MCRRTERQNKTKRERGHSVVLKMNLEHKKREKRKCFKPNYLEFKKITNEPYA